MSNPYETNYGTSFGGWFVYDSNGNTVGFETTAHSFRGFGLYPRSKPVISAPEVQIVKFKVPGRDGEIDATESLTGDIHYYNRTGTWEFTQTGGRLKWDSTYHELKNRLHGQQKTLVIDEERDTYYVGRITVEEPSYDSKRGVAYFTLTADLEPYKKSFTKTTEPWLWDTFSFETGVIPEYMGKTIIAEPGPVSAITWTVTGSRMPVVPHVILEKFTSEETPNIEFTYSYTEDGVAHTRTISLDVGDNVDKLPELVIRQGITYTFYFAGVQDDPTGRGYVSISYREGWL